MMINFLSSLFEEFQYSIVENSDNILDLSYSGIFVKNPKEPVTEFYLVIKIDDLSGITSSESEIIDEIYQRIRNIERNKSGYLGLSKNTSLIILWEIDSHDDLDKKRKVIHEIEEDPYQLKKYVLWYTAEELEELNDVLDDNSYSSIQDVILDTEEFSNFKTIQNASSYYSLLSRIFIKIPALNVEVNVEKLYDLQEKINESLSRESLKNLEEFILEQELSNDESQKQFLEALLSNFEEGGQDED